MSLRKAISKILTVLDKHLTRFEKFIAGWALLSIILLIVLVPGQENIKSLNERIDKERAIDLASVWLSDRSYVLSGYENVVFHTYQKDLVNTLGKEYSQKEVREANLNNTGLILSPHLIKIAFFPEDRKQVTIGKIWDAFASIGGNTPNPLNQGARIEVNLSLQGKILGFSVRGDSSAYPSEINHNILQRVLAEAYSDTLSMSDLGLRNLNNALDNNGESASILLNRKQVTEIARAHLNSTSWVSANFSADTSSISISDNGSSATVDFLSEESILNRKIKASVTVDAGGNLHRITTSTVAVEGYSIPSPARRTAEGLGIFSYFLLCFIAIVLFFRRMGQNLIDGKASRSDAWFASFSILVFLMLNGSQSWVRYNFIGEEQLIAPLVGILFGSAAVWILIYMVSAVATSYGLEIWPRKMKILNLVRKRYIINQPVGLSFIRSLLFGLCFAGIFVVFDTFLPHNGPIITDETVFLSESYAFGWLYLLSSGFFGGIILLFTVLLLVPAWFQKKINRRYTVLFVIPVFWLLTGQISMEFHGWAFGLPLIFLAGFGVAYIFLRVGPLTAILSYLIFEIIVIIFYGLAINNNPDFTNLVLLSLFPLGLLFVGFFGIASGRTSEELPEYIPPYLIDLANRERMERELEIARQVQLGFLPLKNPDIPELDIAANCKAAFEVGGDYYDFIEIGKQKLGIAIGDVSGKGIQAAFYMTLVKGFTQSLSLQSDDPKHFLTSINRLFYLNSKRGTFISMIYGVFNFEANSFRFGRAGHNPAVLMRSTDEKPVFLQNSGIALGLVNDDRFDSSLSVKEVQLNPGDTLVLYTDGYTEAMNFKNELYGEDRMMGVIAANRHRASAELLDAINADVKAFTGDIAQSDDMTMVIIRRESPTTGI